MTGSVWNQSSVVMLMGDGHGERLYPLTRNREKPAVLFGGLYRIVDFPLSNCLNSGLRRIYVLTQQRSLSLERYIRAATSVVHPDLGEFIQTVPPQRPLRSRWYAGTADAVFQNLHLLEEERPEHVLIVSADHVHRMDYEQLLRFHVARGADLTVVCREDPDTEGISSGMVRTDETGRVVGTVNNGATTPLDGLGTGGLENLGVYVFKTAALVRAVAADAEERTGHDLGRDIVPNMIGTHRLCVFDITERCPEAFRYWQGIGTLDSYFQANMDLLLPQPPLDLSDARWPVRSYGGPHGPAVMRDAGDHEARAVNSILSPGCVVSGAQVVRSVLSPNVCIRPGAVVEESILMSGVRVDEDAHIGHAIVDENVVIAPGVHIGCEHDEDHHGLVVTDGAGVVVVPEGTVLT